MPLSDLLRNVLGAALILSLSNLKLRASSSPEAKAAPDQPEPKVFTPTQAENQDDERPQLQDATPGSHLRIRGDLSSESYYADKQAGEDNRSTH
jgi:hypothetical protein